jgi:hypothetical protein
LAALKGLTLGNGEVVLRSVETYDVRLTCTYELRHGGGRTSAIRLDHNTHNVREASRQYRHTGVFFDLSNRGDWKPIDPDKPIILWRNPLTGKELVLKIAGLKEAIAAFEAIPIDEQNTIEFDAFATRMDAAAAPYLGTWYIRGDPQRPCQVRSLGKGDLEFRDGHPFSQVYLCGSTRLSADGRIDGLAYRGHPLALSADGRRLDFVGTDEWWSREPLTRP